MYTFYVAVLFMCTSGECKFMTTPQQVYSSAEVCSHDVSDAVAEFAEKYPNGAIQGACMVVRIGGA